MLKFEIKDRILKLIYMHIVKPLSYIIMPAAKMVCTDDVGT